MGVENINENRPNVESVASHEKTSKDGRGFFSTFLSNSSVCAGSLYGNGYATMYGPPVVKNAIKTYLKEYGPVYWGSAMVTEVVNTSTAYSQAAALTPYLGTAGGVVGGVAGFAAFFVAEKVATVGVRVLCSAGRKLFNVVASEGSKALASRFVPTCDVTHTTLNENFILGGGEEVNN